MQARLDQLAAGFQKALSKAIKERELASIGVAGLLALAEEIRQLAVNLDREVKSTRSSEVIHWAE
jgi:cyclic beta-1,2-glucan synthetase